MGRRFYPTAAPAEAATPPARRWGFVLNLGLDPNPWHNLHWVLPGVSRVLFSTAQLHRGGSPLSTACNLFSRLQQPERYCRMDLHNCISRGFR